jgi:hypothetical protein
VSAALRGRGLVVAALGTVALGATVLLVAEAVTDSRPSGAGWVRAESLEEVRALGVVYVADARAYLVDASPAEPLALYARSPHLGGRIRYCDSSGWFEDRPHGSRFDAVGRYVLGPASRGLDRFGVSVIEGDVWIDTSNLYLGPPRGPRYRQPAGPFCPTD